MMLGPGYQVDELIPQTLNEIRKIIPIKQVTFDRGFDNHKLVYELETLKLNYIIFQRKINQLKKYLIIFMLENHILKYVL